MTPAQQAIVITETVKGVPGCKIAQELGVHESSVCRTRQKPDIKAKVDQAISQLINRGLTPAVRTLSRFAALGNVKGVDKDTAALALKASTTILGHVSGSGPQTVINQLIYSQGTHTDQTPESLAMLSRVLGVQAGDQDVIDITVDK
jgi:hypothetical protein